MALARDFIRLILPRNFAFLQRLPHRFEARVLSLASETTRGKWYEVEINGQKLHLLSKVDLPIGKNVLLEKTQNKNLKLVDSQIEKFSFKETEPMKEFFLWQSFPKTFLEFLQAIFIQEWINDKGKIQKEPHLAIYRFMDNKDSKLRGIFYQKQEKWILFLPESAFEQRDISILKTWLSDLGISQIFLVSDERFNQIRGIDILL